MAKHVLLNNVNHKDVKIKTAYSDELGHNVSKVLTFPTEFGDVQREYPILFEKNGEGGYQSVALLGFEKGENLFLQDGQWKASYVPGVIAREPFLIGFQEQEVDGEVRKEPVIHIDMEDPRVNETEGQPLFLEHGGNTHYLDKVAGILRGIREGMAVSQSMFAAFESCGLIERVTLQVELNKDQGYNMDGYYSVSRDKLYGLDGATLEKLSKSGFLEAAYLVIASLRNMPKLIDMKNRKIASAHSG